MREKGVLVSGIVDQGVNKDILFQFEQALLLLGQPDLIGFIVSLLLIGRLGGFQFKTQKYLARLMGLSEPTFINKRKKLEKIGLIEVEDNGDRRVINLNFLSRLKFFKSPSGYKKLLKYIDTAIKSLKVVDQKEGQLSLSRSIYYINNTKTNTNTNNTIRYPKEYYTKVLDAYKKYKGVDLSGPEIPQHMRAIKTMFKAGRKPEEAVSFMRWLNEHEDDEQTPWVRTWTIWTVQKKLNEFLAGKLRVSGGVEIKPL